MPSLRFSRVVRWSVIGFAGLAAVYFAVILLFVAVEKIDFLGSGPLGKRLVDLQSPSGAYTLTVWNAPGWLDGGSTIFYLHRTSDEVRLDRRFFYSSEPSRDDDNAVLVLYDDYPKGWIAWTDDTHLVIDVDSRLGFEYKNSFGNPVKRYFKKKNDWKQISVSYVVNMPARDLHAVRLGATDSAGAGRYERPR